MTKPGRPKKPTRSQVDEHPLIIEYTRLITMFEADKTGIEHQKKRDDKKWMHSKKQYWDGAEMTMEMVLGRLYDIKSRYRNQLKLEIATRGF